MVPEYDLYCTMPHNPIRITIFSSLLPEKDYQSDPDLQAHKGRRLAHYSEIRILHLAWKLSVG